MEKAVKVLFILLLVVFPLGQIGRVELGGGVALLLNDIVVFAVVTFWLIHKLLSKKPIEARPLPIPLFLFAAAALLSLVANLGKFSLIEISIGSLYLLRWLLYVGLYFVVADFPQKVREKIPFWLVGAGSALTIFGFIQYFLYPDLRNLYYLGWDEHLYRMFSTLLDPNFLGGILVLTFLLALSISFSLKRPRLLRLIFGIVLLGSFVAILLTYSRGSFLSLLVGVAVLLWLMQKKKLIIFCIAISAIGLMLLPKNLQSEGVKLFRTASIDARIESLEHATAIFKDSPLFGSGFNTYRFAKERHGFLKPTKAAHDRSAAGTDNSFLFVLATMGIIGFSAYLYLWFWVIRGDWGNPLLLASLLATFVHALFVNSLFYPWTMEWLWILIGVVNASKAQKLP